MKLERTNNFIINSNIDRSYGEMDEQSRKKDRKNSKGVLLKRLYIQNIIQ